VSKILIVSCRSSGTHTQTDCSTWHQIPARAGISLADPVSVFQTGQLNKLPRANELRTAIDTEGVLRYNNCCTVYVVLDTRLQIELASREMLSR